MREQQEANKENFGYYGKYAIWRDRSIEDVKAQLEENRILLNKILPAYSKIAQIEIIEQGSSYKFCLIAEGSVDYYVRTTTTSEWDTAAGELILSEAGGTTYDYTTGKPLVYNKEELSNPWFIARR